MRNKKIGLNIVRNFMLSNNAKLIYLIIYTTNQDKFTLNKKYIKKMINLKNETYYYKALNELKEKGYLKVEKNNKNKYKYILLK